MLGLLVQVMSFAQTVSIQVINNSTTGAPDSISSLDVYLNDSLYVSATGLGYHEASDLLLVPFTGNTQIAVARSGAAGAEAAFVFYNFTRMEEGKTYTVLLSGGFGDPDSPFQLDLTEVSDSLPLVDDRVRLQPFNGLDNTPEVQLAIQRQTAAAVLPAGHFGEPWSIAPGLQVLQLLPGEGTHQLYYLLDLPAQDKVHYTLLLSGENSEALSPTIQAFDQSGRKVVATPIDLPSLVINEIDYDQPGTDNQEFIELKNTGQQPLALRDFMLELYNGSTQSPYDEFALPDVWLPAQDYFVVCFSESVPNCDLHRSGSIQNGGTAPDGVLLTQNDVIVDALTYEGTLPGITEGSGAILEDDGADRTSLSRFPDGVDSQDNSRDFTLVCSTPGTPNLLNQACDLQPTADSALVQVINNYTGSAQLQVLFGDLDLGTLDHLDATAYLKVPAGELRQLLVVDVAMSVASPLLDTSILWTVDGSYTLVLEGQSTEEVKLYINPQGQAMAQIPFTIDFNFYQGYPAESALDILIKDVGYAAQGLAAHQFTEYSSALPGLYLLELIHPENGATLLTFELDLRTGTGTASTLLLASNQDGGLALYRYDAMGNRSILPLVEFARLQLIQNIPNIEVDIYLNDELFASNLAYRSATSFQQVRANQVISLEIKGAGSTPVEPAILTFSDLNFEAFSSTIMVLGGDGTATSPVDLFTLDKVPESAPGNDWISLGFFHGTTDVQRLSFLGEQFESLAPDLGFGDFGQHQDFAAGELVFATRAEETGRELGFFGADVSAKGGQSGLVFASGIIAGSQSFGLFVAFADGEVIPLERRSYTRVQLVHNAPDTLACDWLYGGRALVQGMAFRSATPYLNLEVGAGGVLQLRRADSLITLATDLNLVDTLRYQFFLSGRLGSAEFPWQLAINAQSGAWPAQAAALSVTAHNGVASSISQDWVAGAGSLLANNLAFGAFTVPTGLPASAQLLRISGGGNEAVFDLLLDTLTPGTALTLFSSEQVNPEMPPGLWAVLPNGTLLSFAEVTYASWQLVNVVEADLDVYLNGILLQAGLDFCAALPFQAVRAGQEMNVTVVPAGLLPGTGTAQSFTFSTEAEAVFSLFMAGDERDIRFFLNPEAQDRANGDNSFTFNFFQGSSSEDALDLLIQGFTRLYENIPFGGFSDYTLIEPLNSDPMITFELARSATQEVIGVYDADFSSFGNQAMTIFSTNGQEPDTDLWVALSDGTTFPFAVLTGLPQLRRPELSLQVYPNPAVSRLFWELDIPVQAPLHYTLIDASGRQLLQRTNQSVAPGKYRETINVGHLPAGQYWIRVQVGDQWGLAKFLVLPQ